MYDDYPEPDPYSRNPLNFDNIGDPLEAEEIIRRNNMPDIQVQDSDSDDNEYHNEGNQNRLLDENEILKRAKAISDLDLPPIPLVKGGYSLENDMLFGWRPKLTHGAPIPLKFPSPMLEDIIKTIMAKPDDLNLNASNGMFPKVVYQGFRPNNTFLLHQKYSSEQTYQFRFSNLLATRHKTLSLYFENEKIANATRPFSGMAWDVDESCLKFDSDFEGGNLDTAIRTGENEYDLFMRVDSNTRGHISWYEEGIGMKPYVMSQNAGSGWAQAGEDVSYSLNNIRYGATTFEEPNRKKYYKTTFTYCFPHDNDTVYFALCVPYTYSQLLKFLQKIGKSSLCYSLGGVKVPLITITDPGDSIPMAERKYVIVTGRIHPGESNGSWMTEVKLASFLNLQGFINQICDKSEISRELRKNFVFKIVPMLNPDGVILGNHRTGVCGSDLNRQFVSPKENIHPTVCAIKALTGGLIQQQKANVFAYIDFHGHSLRKNVFMYGAEFPITSSNYYRVRVLPKLISNRTDMFRYYACIFRIRRSKLTTARAVFSQDYNIAHCYTVEASYSSYMDESRTMKFFDQDCFFNMGGIISQCLGTYASLLEEEKNGIAAQIEEAKAQEEEEDERPRDRTKDKKKTKKTKSPDVDFIIKKSSKKKTIVKAKPKTSEGLKPVPPKMTKLQMLLNDIKTECVKNKDRFEDWSEGGSDSEGSEDDFNGDEMKFLQKEIVQTVDFFKEIMYSSDKAIEDKIKRMRAKTEKKKNVKKDQSAIKEANASSNLLSPELQTLRIPRPISAKVNIPVSKIASEVSPTKILPVQNRSVATETRPIMPQKSLPMLSNANRISNGINPLSNVLNGTPQNLNGNEIIFQSDLAPNRTNRPAPRKPDVNIDTIDLDNQAQPVIDRRHQLLEEALLKPTDHRNYKTTVATKSINLEPRPEIRARPMLKTQQASRTHLKSPQNGQMRDYFVSRPKVSARDPLFSNSIEVSKTDNGETNSTNPDIAENFASINQKVSNYSLMPQTVKYADKLTNIVRLLQKESKTIVLSKSKINVGEPEVVEIRTKRKLPNSYESYNKMMKNKHEEKTKDNDMKN